MHSGCIVLPLLRSAFRIRGKIPRCTAASGYVCPPPRSVQAASSAGRAGPGRQNRANGAALLGCCAIAVAPGSRWRPPGRRGRWSPRQRVWQGGGGRGRRPRPPAGPPPAAGAMLTRRAASCAAPPSARADMLGNSAPGRASSPSPLSGPALHVHATQANAKLPRARLCRHAALHYVCHPACHLPDILQRNAANISRHVQRRTCIRPLHLPDGLQGARNPAATSRPTSLWCQAQTT